MPPAQPNAAIGARQGRCQEVARQHLAGGQTLYGLYGGLHLAPFGQMQPGSEDAILGLEQYGLRKLAVNHCTGQKAVELMLELGYPVQAGQASQGSKSRLYLGNGEKRDLLAECPPLGLNGPVGVAAWAGAGGFTLGASGVMKLRAD